MQKKIETVFNTALKNIDSAYDSAAYNGDHNLCWNLSAERTHIESLKRQVMEIVSANSSV